MARILISGYYGYDNLGDELLLTALLRQLRSMAPDSQMTVLSAQPRVTEARHQVEAVHRESFRELLGAMARCDLFLSGGGSLLQDGTSRRSLWYYLGLLDLAQRMGKETFVYCQGAGPLDYPLDQSMTRRILSKTTAITLRDQHSQETLQALGLRSSMVVAADPVLSLPLRPGRGDGTQLAWVVHGRYCTPEVCKAMEEALRELNRRGYTSWLLPFCPQEDGPVLKQLALWGRVVSPAQLWPRLRQCGLVLSMRLHGLILGAKLGMELVSMTCDPKSDSFLQELGRAPGLPLSQVTGAELVHAVQTALVHPGRQDRQALDRLSVRLEAGHELLKEILSHFP